jgi:hypothetical protein
LATLIESLKWLTGGIGTKEGKMKTLNRLLQLLVTSLKIQRFKKKKFRLRIQRNAVGGRDTLSFRSISIRQTPQSSQMIFPPNAILGILNQDSSSSSSSFGDD